MLWDLIPHSVGLIPPDTRWETDGPFDCGESDQQGYSFQEIRVSLPIFITLQRLHAEIHSVYIQCVYIYIYIYMHGSDSCGHTLIHQECVCLCTVCPFGCRVMFTLMSVINGTPRWHLAPWTPYKRRKIHYVDCTLHSPQVVGKRTPHLHKADRASLWIAHWRISFSAAVLFTKLEMDFIVPTSLLGEITNTPRAFLVFLYCRMRQRSPYRPCGGSCTIWMRSGCNLTSSSRP